MQSSLFSATKTHLASAALILKRNKDAIAVTLSIAAFVTSGINYYVSHIWHAHDLRAALIIGPLSAQEKEIPLLLVNAGKSTEILVGARFALERDRLVREMPSLSDPFTPIAIQPGEVRQLMVANNQEALKSSASAFLNPVVQRTERADDRNAHLELTYIEKDHNLATARLQVGEMIIDESSRKAMGVVFQRAQSLNTIVGR